MLTKEECKEALSSIEFTLHLRVKPKKLGHSEDDNLNVLWELIKEHFSNPPLKFKFKLGELVFNAKNNHIGTVEEILISNGEEITVNYNVHVMNKALSYYELTKEADLVKRKEVQND